jgi:hypothetical protein
MHSETAKGEKPALTSFVGASAVPSQTPAARPQITPKPWSERLAAGVCKFTPTALSVAIWLQKVELLAVNKDQQTHSHHQYHGWDPELNVRQDGPQCFRAASAFLVYGHPLLTPGLT